MSTDRDTTRIVRSWLEEGVTALPDRVLDSVLDQVPATHQRRATWWPARRIAQMNTAAKFGLAAAAVVVAALLGYSYLVASNVGGPGLDDSSPIPASTPTPTPQTLGSAPLDPGPVVATGFGESGSVTFRFTVPDGWVGFSGVGVLPATGTEGPDGMGIVLGEVTGGMFADPCQWRAADPEVPVGPTVDDLVNAFGEQAAYAASAPVDVSLGGYSGKRVTLQLPSDVAPCDNGEFYPWVGSIFAQGPDNRWDVWILDVEGDRIVAFATYFPGTSAEDRAEQQAIIDSIVIER
jgi:hypothetical protein